MKVLVTGGAGYIGVRLLTFLAREGHQAVCFDLRSDQVPVLLEPATIRACEFINGDVRSLGSVHRVIPGVDAVVHLAGVVGHPACSADPDLAYSVNVVGTRNIVDALSADVPVVFASSYSVYGRSPTGIRSDLDPVQPLTAYSQTKAEGERLVLERGGVALRFATVYGPSAKFRWDLLVHTLFRDALTKGRIEVFEGHAWRPLLHVDDAARIVIEVLKVFSKAAGQSLNVGSDDSTVTKYQLALDISSLTGAEVCDRQGSDPDGRDYRVTFERLKVLGAMPRISLADGLSASLDYARECLARDA
jgi:nucleoside-diphosphate-sugar epimerase